jgi:hypothetical protein
MPSLRSLVLVLLFSAVGGLVGGLVAVATIGIDPHPFRSVPAVAESPAAGKPCYRVDLTGKIIGPC